MIKWRSWATNLIGVTVVVLAVDFMGVVIVGETDNLVQYGAAIGLPIAASGVFVALRARSAKFTKEAERAEQVQPLAFSAIADS